MRSLLNRRGGGCTHLQFPTYGVHSACEPLPGDDARAYWIFYWRTGIEPLGTLICVIRPLRSSVRTAKTDSFTDPVPSCRKLHTPLPCGRGSAPVAEPGPPG